MKTADLHRHKCDATGKGMSEGWYIDGEYFSTQESADKRAREHVDNDGNNFKNFKELYEDSTDTESPDYNTDYCYWTTWHQDNFDLEAEGEAYDDDGNYYRFINGKWFESDNQTIAENLELWDTGDGVEYEIWRDSRTDIKYIIPIEIVRDFNDLNDKEKNYNSLKEL